MLSKHKVTHRKKTTAHNALPPRVRQSSARCIRGISPNTYNLREPKNLWIKSFVFAMFALQRLANANIITNSTRTPVDIVNTLNTSLFDNVSSTDQLAGYFNSLRNNNSELIHFESFPSADSPVSEEYPGLVSPTGVKAVLPWLMLESLDSLEQFIKDLADGNFNCTFSVTVDGAFKLGDESVNTLSNVEMDAFYLLIEAGLVNRDAVCSGDGSIMITLTSLKNNYLVKFKISKEIFYPSLSIICAFLFCVCLRRLKFYRYIIPINDTDTDVPSIDVPPITDIQLLGDLNSLSAEITNPADRVGGGKNNKKYKKTAEKYGRRCIYISNRNAKYLKIKGEFVAYKTAIKMLNK